MTKLEAKAELRRAHLAATGAAMAPGVKEACEVELALYYAPGPYGQQLSEAEADARQEARLLALTEASVNGQD